MDYKTISQLFCTLLLIALCSCAKPISIVQNETEQVDLSCSYFYFLWGSHAEFNGHFLEAIEAYEKALICDPTALYVEEKIPTLLLKTGKIAKASAWLKTATIDHPDNINYKLLLANIYIQEEDTESAIALYNDVLQNDPDNENVSIQLGILYIHQKQFEKAENLLAELIEKNNSSYYPILFLARVQKQLGKIVTSIEGYEKALALNWSTDIAYELGHLYVSQKMYEDGLRIFTTITDNDQLDEQAALSRVQALLDLKLNEEALKGLRNTRLFSKNPDKIDLVISKVLIRQKQVSDARVILKRLTKESDLSEPLYMLALLDFQDESYESSMNYLNSITPESIEFEEAIYLKTRIFQKLNKPEEAITVLQELIGYSDTRSPLFYALLSSLYQENSDKLSAITLLEEATQLYPDNYQLFFEYGLLLEQLKRQDEAIVQMQKVIEIKPDHADALNFIGYTWADRNIHLQQALKYILKAVELKPDNGYILDSLGWVYYRLKDYAKAIKWLEKSLELKPDDPHIYDHLGDSYNATNQKKRALEAYQTAYDMFEDEEKKNSIMTKINDLNSI